MGLWSALGALGAAIAAPVTGGMSLAALPAIIGAGGGVVDALAKGGQAAGTAGQILGGQQAGANNARVAQGQLNQGADRNAVDLYQAQQAAQNQAAQTDLQRQQFSANNRSQTAKQALIGALLGGGVTPTSVGPGGASGGLLRSLNANPDALAALKLLGSQGSAAQSTPLTFTGGQLVAPPTLTPVPKIDVGNSLTGNLTNLAQILGGITPYITKKKPDDGDYSTPPEDDPAGGN